MRLRVVLLLAILLGFAPTAFAQYSKSAGQNAPTQAVRREVRDLDGVIREKIVQERVAGDKWGNAQGNQHDLAVDGAFDGQTVAVIQLYTLGFDFELAKAALKEKGFSTYRWINKPPSPEELAKGLAKASQLWIIATDQQLLDEGHLRVIKRFYEDGHGVYIWGDNQPYYADANYVAQALFGTTMQGDLFGDQTVGLQATATTSGLLPNHLLTTGIERIYEGITIATIQPNRVLTPLIYGSAGNLVAAFYDRDGKRAILDGGFTRLYNKWDTAGTARYVKNAAAWLVNAERFGDAVIAKGVRTDRVPAMIVTAKPAPPTAPTAAPATVQASDDSLATGAIGLLLFALMSGFMLAIYLPDLRKQ